MRYEFYDDLSQLENLSSYLIPVTHPREELPVTQQHLEDAEAWSRAGLLAWLQFHPGQLAVERAKSYMDRLREMPGELARWLTLKRLTHQLGSQTFEGQTYLFGEDEQAYIFSSINAGPSAEGTLCHRSSTSTRQAGEETLTLAPRMRLSELSQRTGEEIQTFNAQEGRSSRSNLERRWSKHRATNMARDEITQYLLPRPGKQRIEASAEKQNLVAHHGTPYAEASAEKQNLIAPYEVQYAEELDVTQRLFGCDETRYLPGRKKTLARDRVVHRLAPAGGHVDVGAEVRIRESEVGPGNLVLLCTRCSAEFIPSQLAPSLLRTSPEAAEQAFLKLCHTCPVCKQLACPCCWNSRYQRCLPCAQPVGLPLRLQTRSLERNPGFSQFVCMSPGRFQLQEGGSRQPQLANLDPLNSVYAQNEQDPSPAGSWFLRQVNRLEHILTVWVCLLLCAIVIMCVLSLCFEPCNTLFAYWLHVDFRREIDFCLHMLQLFHA